MNVSAGFLNDETMKIVRQWKWINKQTTENLLQIWKQI